MAQPVTVTVNGAVSAAPSASNALVPSLTDTVMFGFNKTYSYKFADSFSINAPVTPVAVNFGSITNLRFMFIRVIGQPVTVAVTWPSGTLQTMPVSDEWLWSSPSTGFQITAMTLLGVSDLELLLAGD